MSVIVITGASDGIGAELARQWARAQRGRVALVLAARNVEKLRKVADACREHDARVFIQPCDVSQQADCTALIASAIAQCGRIDTLVNNAGVSAHARFDETPDLGWTEALMRTNHWGSVWCTHAALPYLKESKGRIVAVASLAGLVGVPYRTAYCASKFAMVGFFEALRTELIDSGVSVTITYPGVVDTEIRRLGYGPLGRPAGVSGLKEERAMPVDECAQLIRTGAERRSRDVVMTAQGKLGRWLKLAAPAWVDKLAWRALQGPNKR